MQDEIAELQGKINRIHGLKHQLDEILEHLKVISNKPEATTRDEGVQSSIPLAFQPGTSQTRDLYHGNQTNQEFPLYDMPINYEPLYEEGAEPETIPDVLILLMLEVSQSSFKYHLVVVVKM